MTEMRLGQFQRTATGQRYLRFKLSARRFYIPLGWNDWTVAKHISLVPDPTQQTLTLYNHRVKWNITDRWPTSWCSPNLGEDSGGDYSSDEECSPDEDEDEDVSGSRSADVWEWRIEAERRRRKETARRGGKRRTRGEAERDSFSFYAINPPYHNGLFHRKTVAGIGLETPGRGRAGRLGVLPGLISWQ
jgi:hypothetical protein